MPSAITLRDDKYQQPHNFATSGLPVTGPSRHPGDVKEYPSININCLVLNIAGGVTVSGNISRFELP